MDPSLPLCPPSQVKPPFEPTPLSFIPPFFHSPKIWGVVRGDGMECGGGVEGGWWGLELGEGYTHPGSSSAERSAKSGANISYLQEKSIFVDFWNKKVDNIVVKIGIFL